MAEVKQRRVRFVVFWSDLIQLVDGTYASLEHVHRCGYRVWSGSRRSAGRRAWPVARVECVRF